MKTKKLVVDVRFRSSVLIRRRAIRKKSYILGFGLAVLEKLIATCASCEPRSGVHVQDVVFLRRYELKNRCGHVRIHILAFVGMPLPLELFEPSAPRCGVLFTEKRNLGCLILKLRIEREGGESFSMKPSSFPFVSNRLPKVGQMILKCSASCCKVR